MSDARILAFDTSAAHCAAALIQGGRLLAQAREEMARGQAERLMPMLEEVSGGWRVDALAVCTGPGNFTGIRIAVAAARGLALAKGIPAVGVSVLESLAPVEGAALVTADARQGRFYAQMFRDGAAQAEIRLVTLDEIAQAAPQDWQVIGHRAEEVADRLAAPCWREAEVADLAAVARIGAERIAAGEVTRPAPLYVRPADAALPSEPPPVILP
ncbi:tRNA (adenosine(37)-N6)-threonylcarbamoyltransferase complex dimerization subunit type 1 TsaB [Roseobacter sp. HKCCA0434]|uniref:tRNA (adenosine(37)-N6)-threonylcarbamoyltransferase complex dimerization subunit type 1 TsaB n=1 Tax=Roseobacter sp. HKCCA0434 TaxID=3079297 RepID=UPI0029058DEC|nr:tRNA (adenosine(37)-N6)-threonylcarbamoyltransferase complex dimerization subunit type 1 TsaB [Roseobacter sp. HKCCA0434]